ncbi:hypothetical protein P154DRAFT_581806 [Amniculicola lignicola CBS 123094]|uniref:UbiA prenyltransferase n=1 Tax=Amniculicola lignicola CBS 123094 TaxID=1392246 RepID=A0A6A5W0D1_9PLEO|nr:hypothetical protein P154DRAFT_581806 [Amniculicola lignicola CBS 123094]
MPSGTTSKPFPTPLSLLRILSSFAHTLYLFTHNDFLTFALPTLLFALFGALSGPILTTNTTPSLLAILSRIPQTLLLIWSNLLIFDISNQRSPIAVEEDKINKPHRPIPAGRITCAGADSVLMAAVPAVLALSCVWGVWQETLTLLLFTYMYNDLCLSDYHWTTRNSLIAIGYALYSSLALRIMVGSECTLTSKGWVWIGVVFAIMLFTQHICDIKDAPGDKLRGRQSAPVVLGDDMVRCSVAIPVMLCSVLCPAFFSTLGPVSYVLTLSLGSVVALRTLLYRSLDADKLTWKLWALWTTVIFALPLAANAQVFDTQVFVNVWTSLQSSLCGGDCASSLNIAAVSSVALIVEGRRILGGVEVGDAGNQSIPMIVIEGVTV